jgi:hypothetical protein
MNIDEIVNEVRIARDSHAKKFNYNIHEICADLIKKQQANKDRLVSLSAGKSKNRSQA